jgi:hypothetical protein
LLEDYLAKLLPIDPLQQAKLFSQDIHSHQLTSPSGGQGANLMHQTPGTNSTSEGGGEGLDDREVPLSNDPYVSGLNLRLD